MEYKKPWIIKLTHVIIVVLLATLNLILYLSWQDSRKIFELEKRTREMVSARGEIQKIILVVVGENREMTDLEKQNIKSLLKSAELEPVE